MSTYIKPWFERPRPIREGMEAEIAELRAALTAQYRELSDLVEMQPGGALYQPPTPVGYLFGNSYYEVGNPRLTDEIKRLGKARYGELQAPSAPVARQPLENIEQLDERAAFETQMRAMGADEFTLRKWVALTDAGPTYRNQIVQDHWRVWQARAALSVKVEDAINLIIGHIADNWPMKKYTLVEIEDRLRAFAAPTPPTTGEA